MTVQEILRQKGNEVYSISPQATLADVVRSLVAHHCGSLVVLEEDKLVGIITERDILRVCAGGCDALAELPVYRYMTTDLVTGQIQDDLATVMGLMTANRVRHLPVLEDGRLVGLISIGDVVKRHYDQLMVENHYLMNYIRG